MGEANSNRPRQRQRPPATMIQIPASNDSSLTEPLLTPHNKKQQHQQFSSLEPTESDSQSSCGGMNDATKSQQQGLLSASTRTEATTESTSPSKRGLQDISGGASLLSDLTTNELDNTVGKLLRQGSLATFVTWLVLLTAALTYAPADSFEHLEGAERHANITVLVLLLYTNISRIARMVIRDRGFFFVNSGVMCGYITVQTIAIVSIALMIFFPTPVIIDPVTGIRSHLVRWAEWVAAGFLMTFLVESVDLPVSTSEQQRSDRSKTKQLNIPLIAWMHGIAIGVSTAGGAISAFCDTWSQWLAVIGTSWVLFCSLFVRLRQRYRRVENMGPGVSVDEKEDYDRAKYSLKTITVCTAVWTALAGCWTMIAVVTPFVSAESIFSNPALVLISESLFESISKIWYADLLIEIHEIVFDDASRTMRRLEELRNLMSAVWDHSSDILIWGSRAHANDNIIQGIVSPKGGDFLGQDLRTMSNGRCTSTLLIEADLETQQHRCFVIDLSTPITREGAIALRNMKLQEKDSTAIDFSDSEGDKNVAAIVDLLCEAHGSDDLPERTIMCELASESEGKLHQCEANISRLSSTDSTLIVIRDISERFERFETEKKLIAEKTARKKDSQANKFTRHEIKNSILAAIGLVETIREGAANKTTSSSQSIATRSSDPSVSASLPNTSIPRNSSTVTLDAQEREGDTGSSASVGTSVNSYYEDSYAELDNTLRDILDTIMDHAMSLDVVNEEYDVRKERVDVPFILSNIKRQTSCGPSSSRFLITSRKEPFPKLGLDPRLLRHIYQNALSNATRYGKPNGTIQTIIDYDDGKKEFSMDVINEPGSSHGKLVALSTDEIDEKVFSQGSRLVSDNFDDEVSEVHDRNSSGDGAWIMRKCANVMKGFVEILFEADRTVLSFRCPAKIVKRHSCHASGVKAFTHLPRNTWGIAVDDSGIQRKLMDRFLKIAGIDSERRIILGKDADECYNFCDEVEKVLLTNQHDKVLLIADENLDVVDGGARSTTVSGSLCIEQMLKRLDPKAESRLLALVRSANDSSPELKLYKSRAHGFLPKAPMDKNGVLSVIQPWWIKRFTVESTGEKRHEFERQDSDISVESDTYDAFSDIVEVIEVIAALCRVGSSSSLRKRWRSIKDKLHSLKGDLKSTIVSRDSGNDLQEVIADIDALRSGDFPRDVRQRWTRLEAKLYKTINANR